MRERWQVYKQIMYNAKVKVPWLVGTKHFPESKTLLDSEKCFGEVFLDSGKCFGFWEVFCPYKPPYKGTLSVTSAYAMPYLSYKFPNSLDTSPDLSRPKDLRANHILQDKFKYKSQLYFPPQITGTCTILT